MKKARTKKDIELDHRVKSIEKEVDGNYTSWWLYLKEDCGWRYDDNSRIIHEPTIAEVCTQLKSKLMYQL